MKILFKSSPRPRQDSMVVMTSMGTFGFEKLGEIYDIQDVAACEIIAKWPKCFEQVKQPAPSVKKEKTVESEAMKMAASYANKSLAAE